MRPAQLTPENAVRGPLRRDQARRFNEAGAINAGKPTTRKAGRRTAFRFNEAGAINAGKLRRGVRRYRRCGRFNEAGAINAGKRRLAKAQQRGVPASMRPAQLTPENVQNQYVGHFQILASMRPAQLTPENSRSWPSARRSAERFNEAGAINAGKRATRSTRSPSRWAGFNEAGAINAGKPGGELMSDAIFTAASMRPAQLTPENCRRESRNRSPCCGFNEAGAINAGKRNRIIPVKIIFGSFNEAGAINAGKPPTAETRIQERSRASMRPAQLTPENNRDNTKS